MKILWTILKSVFFTWTWVATAAFWLWEAASRTIGIAKDIQRARRTYRGGILHCPNGHPIEPAGVFQCPACSWVFRDDAYGLICPNPECDRPNTNVVQCSVCGESQRNPMRFGRR